MRNGGSDVSIGRIGRSIQIVRGEKVIIDADLADFYGVSTKRLNEQVKRNSDRFPADFMFQLTAQEKKEVVANCDHLSKLKYSNSFPNAFTEHGAIMAASVLSSARAISVSVFIVRTFIEVQRTIEENKELAKKKDKIEKHLAEHDVQIVEIVMALKKLIKLDSVKTKRRIGFQTNDQ